MRNETYNGWTNYETWAVALWLDNEEPTYRYWREQAIEHRKAAPSCRQVKEGIWLAKDAAKFNLADHLEEEIRQNNPLTKPSLYSDLLGAALGEVNWQEIAQNWLSEVEEPGQPAAGPVVYSYSRAQAIADGVLVNATPTACEAGIKYPTAVTAAVWEQCVKVPDGAEGQDEGGRLWDVVWMLRTAMTTTGHTDTLYFTVLVNNDDRGPQPVSLRAVCGPGDAWEPVITVMFPEED